MVQFTVNGDCSGLNNQPCILLTRPEGYNDALADKLIRAGYQVLERPMLFIKPLEANADIHQRAMNLDRYDVAIFVSRNAVVFGIPHLLDYWPQWPERLIWCAVGKQTAKELREFDIDAVYPESPGALELINGMDWRDVERVLIVRGKDGLEILHTELVDRGIKVDYLEVYERTATTWPNLQQDIRQTDIIVMTSGVAIETLCRFLDSGDLTELDERGQTMVVPSERVRKIATSRGLQNTVIANDMSDLELIVKINDIISRRIGTQQDYK